MLIFTVLKNSSVCFSYGLHERGILLWILGGATSKAFLLHLGVHPASFSGGSLGSSPYSETAGTLATDVCLVPMLVHVALYLPTFMTRCLRKHRDIFTSMLSEWTVGLQMVQLKDPTAQFEVPYWLRRPLCCSLVWIMPLYATEVLLIHG